MNIMLLRALVGLVVVAPLLIWSLLRLRQRESAGAKLQAIGAISLLAVVGAHICEALRIFPAIGWGRPNTVGHYFDLTGATLGLTLVPIGYILSRSRRG
jgi:hypothetical protein